MMRNFVGILFLILSAVGSAHAQRIAWRTGGMVQAGMAFHDADFKELPGVPLPPGAGQFSGTTGFSYGAGWISEWPLVPWFAFGGQLDIQRYAVDLTADEGPLPFELSDGTIGELFLRHNISHSLFTVGVQPLVVLTPWEPLVFRAGIRVAIPVAIPVVSSFKQTEIITNAPAGLEYLIGDTVRTRASGTSLPEAPPIETEAEAGIGFNIPLDNSLLLRPVLSYRIGFTDRAAGISWKTGTLQLGVSLFRQFMKEKELRIDTVYKRDTTVQLVAGIADDAIRLTGQSAQVEETGTDDVIFRTVVITEQYTKTVLRPVSVLTAGLDVRFVLEDGRETEGVRVSVETVLEKNVVPMLPYIFFEPTSAAIPPRYANLSQQEATAFTPEQLDRNDMLGIYRNLLNIVGQRLQQNPGAKLVLTGANSGEGDERRNIELSQMRAEAVRRYLVDVWGINPERLDVRAVGLPVRPSNSSLPGGNEENRRVELLSDDPSILAPLFLQDTVRVANPPIIRFYPQVLSEAGIADWQITISQGERFRKTFANSSEPPEYVDWNIGQDKAALISADAPMQYTLRVRDLEEGVVETEQGSITFQVRQQGQALAEGRGEVTRYSLIVFDYDGADLTRLHRAALADIRETLPSDAGITIVGMTDELGDEAYNQQLSERRAKVIAAALSLPPAVALGIGEQSDLTSETPESRFYSRRVDILIRRNGSP